MQAWKMLATIMHYFLDFCLPGQRAEDVPTPGSNCRRDEAESLVHAIRGNCCGQ